MDNITIRKLTEQKWPQPTIDELIGNNHMAEFRAYSAERKFQEAAGLLVEYPDDVKLWRHIIDNYPKYLK